MTEQLQALPHEQWILSNSNFVTEIDSKWFDQEFWLNQGRLLGASSGRGSAWMVKSESQKMMLRHYYRGGVPAKFNKDKYLWTGLDRTRSFKEFRLLQEMKDLELPVPSPVAAQVLKNGLFYQANILIEYLQHEQTFGQALNQESNEKLWKDIGKTIARFHMKGVNHSDLNANNILIGEGVYLIDFDNSKIGKPNHSSLENNLKRLQRSINKLTNPEFFEQNKELWSKLVSAYQHELN